MRSTLHFRIAGHPVAVYADYPDKISKLLPGFGRFLAPDEGTKPFLQFDIESDTLVGEVSYIKKEVSPNEDEYTIIHTFNLEQGYCTLSKKGNHFFCTIQQEGGEPSVELELEMGSPQVTCKLSPDYKKNPLIMARAGHLKFSLWMAFAFAGIPGNFCAVHSSVIVYNNLAIIFLGESGTGKSTHTKLWLQHISGSWLLNDDSPILSIEEDMPWVYGSPWSGKGNCYVNERYPLQAIVRLQQHPVNKMNRLNKIESFGALYPSFPPAWLKDEYFEESICVLISKVIITTPVYRLSCLPDQAAAELVWETVLGGK